MAIDSLVAHALAALRHALPDNPVLAVLALLGLCFIGAVALNVAHQLLLPKDPSLPPEVFHFVPFVGSAVPYGIDPYKFLFANRDKYGNVFTFTMIGRKITVALSPAGSNMVLNGKIAHVSAEEAYTHLTTPVFGTDVVYDCPNHLLMEQKKFIKFGLTTENFRAYIPIIVKETFDHIKSELFNAPGKKTGDKSASDMAAEITICTASATLQGPEVRAALDKSFAQLYHDLDGGFTPLNFVFPKLPLPSYYKRDAAHINMRKFYIDIIERRRKEGSKTEIDMIQNLTGKAYKDGHVLTDKEVAHMMIALLMAGQHTSAATTGWLLLHIGADQNLQKQLYDEQVKYYGNADGTFKDLDYETLQTPLLHATIRETLRMHPPLHSIMRKVISDMPVPSDLAKPNTSSSYVIPKGHYVLAAPGVTQMDPDHWKNPADFDPQRWLTATGAAKEDEEDAGEKMDFGWGVISTGAASPYLPFGAGRHRCIGEQFAHLQLASIMATFLRNTKWNIDTVPDPDYTTMLVGPKKPDSIHFESR